jgi:predicted peroxiredoxin
MEKIVNLLIDEAVQNADTYTNNGSTWLIFTDDKRWVIELTKDGTLWYNYNFFKSLFAYTSMDVVENQHYITKWVEDNIINKKTIVQNGVNYVNFKLRKDSRMTEDTIKNGVKHTEDSKSLNSQERVEDTIQNGVKEINKFGNMPVQDVENIIQNGVKHTETTKATYNTLVEYTIQNGVKHTIDTTHHKNKYVEDAIINGVKETNHINSEWTFYVEDTIENGVKETKIGSIYPQKYVEKIMQNGIKETQGCGWSNQGGAENAIKNGVKETKTPGADGDILGALDFLSDNNTVNIPQLIDDVIKNGVKRTIQSKMSIPSDVEDTIQNGVRSTETRMWVYLHEVEDTIQNGVKETCCHDMKLTKSIENTIQNGVKKTYSDKIPHEYDWSDQFTEDVEYTIQNGVKHTEKSLQIDGSCVVEDVLKNGVKETHDDVYHHTGRVEGVIKNGVKKIEPMRHLMYNPMDFSAEYGENRRLPEVTSVLEKGIKEVQPLPSQDGNRDWGNYYHRKEDRTKPHTQYVNDVIENGKKI